jgi:hypothetical protein
VLLRGDLAPGELLVQRRLDRQVREATAAATASTSQAASQSESAIDQYRRLTATARSTGHNSQNATATMK